MNVGAAVVNGSIRFFHHADVCVLRSVGGVIALLHNCLLYTSPNGLALSTARQIYGIGASVYEVPRNVDSTRTVPLTEGMTLVIAPIIQPQGKDPYCCKMCIRDSSMLGGGFFALAPMMMPHKPAADTVNRFSNANTNVEQQLKDNIYFEISHAQPWGKAQLECAVRVLGADHIVFGTSYPVRRPWLLEGPDFIRDLDITEEEKALILYKNAERLYHL